MSNFSYMEVSSCSLPSLSGKKWSLVTELPCHLGIKTLVLLSISIPTDSLFQHWCWNEFQMVSQMLWPMQPSFYTKSFWNTYRRFLWFIDSWLFHTNTENHIYWYQYLSDQLARNEWPVNSNEYAWRDTLSGHTYSTDMGNTVGRGWMKTAKSALHCLIRSSIQISWQHTNLEKLEKRRGK